MSFPPSLNGHHWLDHEAIHHHLLCALALPPPFPSPLPSKTSPIQSPVPSHAKTAPNPPARTRAKGNGWRVGVGRVRPSTPAKGSTPGQDAFPPPPSGRQELAKRLSGPAKSIPAHQPLPPHDPVGRPLRPPIRRLDDEDRERSPAYIPTWLRALKFVTPARVHCGLLSPPTPAFDTYLPYLLRKGKS